MAFKILAIKGYAGAGKTTVKKHYNGLCQLTMTCQLSMIK